MMHKRGMTLMELILAMALFSALLGAIGGLLISSVRANDAWGKTLEPYEQLERGFNRLSRDCESAQPIFTSPAAGDKLHFELARVEQAGESPEQAQWRRIVYRLVPEGSETLLVREAFALGQNSPEPVSREMLFRLQSGHFEFGELDAQHVMQWVSAWDGKNGVPRMVRFAGLLADSLDEQPVVRVMRNPAGTLPVMEQP